jgi:hypothetical protein
MKLDRFKQLLESSVGNVKPLILEDDKTENFLKNYVGKTITMYQNPECTEYSITLTISNIKYNGGSFITINTTKEGDDNNVVLSYDVACLFNPTKFSNEYILSSQSISSLKSSNNYLTDSHILRFYAKLYNKTLLNDIFTKGSQIGIQFCKKPKTDFGSTDSSTKPSIDLT